ncbi:hypothetical protein [Brevibacillus brevis]|uniref:MmcQ/YjbR family DNA-binding protein n=1 Tax=Brevibacillus brevis TaxID=1393 RepID=A0ABY9TCS8_BREBE|nr:hypothetical protein [Brevibacillus brevis]WNC17918.1 hypothetical protein RGB73_30145 [Brevibacillus brevis]
MLKENEMRILEAPSEIFVSDDIKPNKYIIQNIDNCHFVIHRELSENEMEQTLPNHMLFDYEGKSWLAVIATFGSEEEAEIAVHSYWNAIKQLVEMSKN